MLVMTAKMDVRKLVVILICLVAAIAIIAAASRGGDKTVATVNTDAATNDDRVSFLKGFGWDVTVSPTESSQVRIPQEASAVYDRYNTLQKQQGYDLTQYAGKTVMRYVYKVNNYPGASEPVYATLLVYKNKIIGGDITDTAAKGQIRTFQMPKAEETTPSSLPEATGSE